MIELITGLPGNGKTLYTISHVKKMAEAENRPVFYSGIKGLSLPWTEIDPTKWMDAPAKAIIVIDEAQKTFRNRTLGAVPPLHVTELEEHRHRGVDLVLMTQHPSLVDPAIRRLAGSHKHLVRIWGMEASTVHHWPSVKDNCDKSRTDSEKTKWAFDKSVYALYKSAEEHTMKRAIPGRVKLLLALPLVLGLCAYGVHTIMNRHKPLAHVEASQAIPGTAAGAVAAPLAGTAKPAKFDPVEDARHYVDMNTPRVAGLPQTAPRYDELTKPVRVPVPAACIEFRGACKCLTQQGTPMDVKPSMCIEFARNGFFQDFDPEKDRVATERTASSVRVLEGRGNQQEEGEAGKGGRQSSQVAVFAVPPPEAPHKPSVGS